MKRLLESARRAQWSVETDIDWDQPIAFPLWFRRSTYIKVVSQFYHGEMIIQRLCRRLIAELADPEAQELVRMQLTDEVRHASAFERYLRRIGDLAPVEEALQAALEQSLAWKGSPHALIAAFHVVFEGGASALLQQLNSRFPCPLLRQINAKVLADEARHIAFGKLYLRRHLAELSDDERLEIYRWLKAVWREPAETARRRYSLPVAMATRLGRNWLSDGWERQGHILVDIGLIGESERVAI